MPHSHSSDGDLLPGGSVIANRYELQSTLGVGGMGTVYLATDKLLDGIIVAIKVVHREYCSHPALRKRFFREVKLMNMVNHKNVVRTFEVGEDGNHLYYTMEYVPGIPLSEFDGISIDAFPDLIDQICSGLGAIHASEILHRDLKPGNILVLPDHTVKITDFGVARPKVSNLTQHEEIIGSIDYLAPEIWLGTEMGPSIDFYSLGVILYELLTGVLPFESDRPANVMWMHVNQVPAAPIDLVPETPLWLNNLIVSLLAKTSDERPATAGEIKAIALLGQSGPVTRSELSELGMVPVEGPTVSDESHLPRVKPVMASSAHEGIIFSDTPTAESIFQHEKEVQSGVFNRIPSVESGPSSDPEFASSSTAFRAVFAIFSVLLIAFVCLLTIRAVQLGGGNSVVAEKRYHDSSVGIYDPRELNFAKEVSLEGFARVTAIFGNLLRTTDSFSVSFPVGQSPSGQGLTGEGNDIPYWESGDIESIPRSLQGEFQRLGEKFSPSEFMPAASPVAFSSSPEFDPDVYANDSEWWGKIAEKYNRVYGPTLVRTSLRQPTPDDLRSLKEIQMLNIELEEIRLTSIILQASGRVERSEIYKTIEAEIKDQKVLFQELSSKLIENLDAYENMDQALRTANIETMLSFAPTVSTFDPKVRANLDGLSRVIQTYVDLVKIQTAKISEEDMATFTELQKRLILGRYLLAATTAKALQENLRQRIVNIINIYNLRMLVKDSFDSLSTNISTIVSFPSTDYIRQRDIEIELKIDKKRILRRLEQLSYEVPRERFKQLSVSIVLAKLRTKTLLEEQQ
jgi:serine/threonine protein kinase